MPKMQTAVSEANHVPCYRERYVVSARLVASNRKLPLVAVRTRSMGGRRHPARDGARIETQKLGRAGRQVGANLVLGARHARKHSDHRVEVGSLCEACGAWNGGSGCTRGRPVSTTYYGSAPVSANAAAEEENGRACIRPSPIK